MMLSGLGLCAGLESEIFWYCESLEFDDDFVDSLS
jgi:hypothetical protein